MNDLVMRSYNLLALSAFFVLLILSSSFAGPDFRTVDTVQLHSMIVDNAYRMEGGRGLPFAVIDARTKEEYDENHIFSAINIPESGFERSISLLPKDKKMPIVVYGDGAQHEADRLWAMKAASAGYSNVYIYDEGLRVWNERKMPVATRF